MFSYTKAFTVACIAAISPIALADQPVHCKSLSASFSGSNYYDAGLKSQVAGYWTFEVSREAIKPDLATADSICSHELPNK